MGINIRLAKQVDLDGIVAIHQAAFNSFFLTSLGKHFLSCYYSAFIKSDKGVVLCAEKEGNIVGFSACSYFSKGFNSSLIKKNLFRFGLEAVRLVFTRPKAIVRLARNMNKESSDAKINDKGQYSELYSIAVSPTCQGEGVGKLLLTATENDVREHNKQISLTTDYFDNEKTIAFYHTLGYQDYYEFVTYPERRMWRMLKEL